MIASTGLDVETWIRSYARAWQTADAELAAALFTDDAIYRSNPFAGALLGLDEIRGYWRRVTARQRRVRVRLGSPWIADDRVAVEWWTTMIEDGRPTTLPGCLLLRFAADGRCSELREYWHQQEGLLEPFLGWAASHDPDP